MSTIVEKREGAVMVVREGVEGAVNDCEPGAKRTAVAAKADRVFMLPMLNSRMK